MIQAIVYTSNTGYTAEYARMLGEKTGLPVLTLNEAKKSLPVRAPILYLGWLMAGSIKGCGAAIRRFSPRAVCGVGLTLTPSKKLREQNHIPQTVTVFSLQGGFDMERLHGLDKLLMKILRASLQSSMAKKETPDDARVERRRQLCFRSAPVGYAGLDSEGAEAQGITFFLSNRNKRREPLASSEAVPLFMVFGRRRLSCISFSPKARGSNELYHLKGHL